MDFTSQRADDVPATGLLLDGRYWLTELLGEGSSASVYRGTDLRLRRPVAVKIFHAPPTEPTAVGRQHTEMLVLARLNHSNLVSMYDARMMPIAAGDIAADRAQHSYLVMEFVDGGSLARRLSCSAMTLDESAAVGIAVASALAAVHHLGLVHRDVKPANILLPAAGGAKLTDFGIARLLNSPHLTITAEVVGTPLYLSPEQAAGGEVGPGTDIYSLGLVLLECVTGNAEFPGAPVQSAIARTLRDPRVPPDLPAPWPDLLRSMTSSISDERPAADAVAAILTGYLQDRERSRTATTITATATPPGVTSLGNPAIPGRHRRPMPGDRATAAPSVRGLARNLSIASCVLGLAVMTAVIALTVPDGVGGHPAGPTTIDGTTARTVPGRSTARAAIPAVTYRADWYVTSTVTVITAAPNTATPTTTTTTTSSDLIVPSAPASESSSATATSESPAPTISTESTVPTTSESIMPTTTSESTLPATLESATPSTTISESVPGSTPATPSVR